MGVSGLCGCRFACRRWQIYKKPSVRRLSRGIFLLHTAVIMRIYAKNAKEYSFRIFRSCRSVVGVFPLRGGGGDGRGLPEMWCCVLCFPLLFASVDIRGRSCVPLLVFFRVSCCCIRCRPCVQIVQIVQIVRCVQNLRPMYASNVCVQSPASYGGPVAPLRIRLCRRSGCRSDNLSLSLMLLLYVAFALLRLRHLRAAVTPLVAAAACR